MYSYSAFKVLTSVFFILVSSVGLAEDQPKSEFEICMAEKKSLTACESYRANKSNKCDELNDDLSSALEICGGECINRVKKCNGNVSSTSTINSALTMGLMMSGNPSPPAAQAQLCAKDYASKTDAISSYREATQSLVQAQQNQSTAQEQLRKLEEDQLQFVDVQNRKIADTQILCETQGLTANNSENQKVLENLQKQLEIGQNLKAAMQKKLDLQAGFNNAYRQGRIALNKLSNAAILRECRRAAKVDANNIYKNGKSLKTQKKSMLSGLGKGNSVEADLKSMLTDCIKEKEALRSSEAARLEEQLANFDKQIKDQEEDIARAEELGKKTMAALEQEYQNLKRANQLNKSRCGNQVTALINEFNRKSASYPVERQALQQQVVQATQLVNQAQSDVNTFAEQRKGVSGMAKDSDGAQAFAAVNKQDRINKQLIDEGCNKKGTGSKEATRSGT